MQINNSRAIVSGGASGLGLATAEKIIELGGKVALIDINESGETNAKRLGENAIFIKADISSENEIKDAVSSAHEFLNGANLKFTNLMYGYGTYNEWHCCPIKGQLQKESSLPGSDKTFWIEYTLSLIHI